jgi:hypothetical protein
MKFERDRPQKFSFFCQKKTPRTPKSTRYIYIYIGEFLVLLIVTKIILAISLFIYLIAINYIEVTCKKLFGICFTGKL